MSASMVRPRSMRRPGVMRRFAMAGGPHIRWSLGMVPRWLRRPADLGSGAGGLGRRTGLARLDRPRHAGLQLSPVGMGRGLPSALEGMLGRVLVALQQTLRSKRCAARQRAPHALYQCDCARCGYRGSRIGVHWTQTRSGQSRRDFGQCADEPRSSPCRRFARRSGKPPESGRETECHRPRQPLPGNGARSLGPWRRSVQSPVKESRWPCRPRQGPHWALPPPNAQLPVAKPAQVYTTPTVSDPNTQPPPEAQPVAVTPNAAPSGPAGQVGVALPRPAPTPMREQQSGCPALPAPTAPAPASLATPQAARSVPVVPAPHVFVRDATRRNAEPWRPQENSRWKNRPAPVVHAPAEVPAK